MYLFPTQWIHVMLLFIHVEKEEKKEKKKKQKTHSWTQKVNLNTHLINLFVLIILNLTCLTNYAESLCLLLWFFNLLYHGAMDLNFEVIFPFHPFTLWTKIWFEYKGKKWKKREKEKNSETDCYFLLFGREENLVEKKRCRRVFSPC